MSYLMFFFPCLEFLCLFCVTIIMFLYPVGISMNMILYSTFFLFLCFDNPIFQGGPSKSEVRNPMMRRQPNRRQPLAPWGLAGFGGIVASRRQQQQAGQQQGCTDRSHQQATCQPYRVQLQALAVRIQPSM